MKYVNIKFSKLLKALKSDHTLQITSHIFYFTESVRGIKAESNTPNTAGDFPNKVYDLDIVGAWFVTKNGHVMVKTLTVELTAEFEIVMIYIVAKKMRRVEIKLGE